MGNRRWEHSQGNQQPAGLHSYRVHTLNRQVDRSRLWNHARELLGMEVARNGEFGSEQERNAAWRFYLHCGLKSFLFMDGKALYLRIPKSGNDRTRCNLASAPGKGWVVDCPSKQAAKMYMQNGTSVFTVVREPLSRFVSGYTEVEYRTSENVQVQKKFDQPIGSKERIKEYLMHLLQGDTYIEVFHTFSQSWIGVPFARIHAYKLEDNNVGWKSLMTDLGISPDLEYSFRCGGHMSSLDPLRTTAAAKAALRHDPNVTKALCTLLLPDFLNFHYQMPPICSSDKQIDSIIHTLWT